jgi:transposase InsO family protein
MHGPLRVDVIRPHRDKPIAPGSPWQNGFAKRLIGSIRRECVDHIVVLGETHLRRVLKSYARYYNETRTHRSLDQDAPISRPVQRVGLLVRQGTTAMVSDRIDHGVHAF